ncbi:amidase [Lewinella cohaerens]|uniref:amidase n=1 Tax=Lewinella cohaerens TaxID=70995 RepID=UPI0003780696|nr:amidase family protein [Lewinella cohaerens]
MTFSEYRQYDALGLAELVRSGQITATELLNIAITRAEEVNPQLNAINHPLFDHAREQLANHPPTATQLFGGVPFLIKDLGLALKGTPLRIGSRSTEGMVSEVDSHLVQLFQKAGLLILGKTNTPEFGLTPFTEPEAFGATRNPWHTDYTSGGSSGGSAAAIAAGIVPIATASDGGGSIRMPASCCGLFGIKPSRGRLSLGPGAGESWNGAVVEGCNSRSVRDSAAFLDAFSQPGVGELHYAPKPAVSYTDLLATKSDKLRIGFSTEHPLGLPVDKDCKQAVEETAHLLADMGHEVEAIPLPYQREDLTKTFLHLIMGEVSAELKRISKTRGSKVGRSEVEANTYALSLLGDAISAGDYAYYRSLWNGLARRQGNFHQTYHCLLTPTVATAPFPVGSLQSSPAEKLLVNVLTRLRLGSLMKANIEPLAEKIFAFMPYTPIANMTGQPAMSMPLHWNAKGLPVGVMFTAGIYREDILFKLAAQLEKAKPWMERVAEV